MARLLPLLIRVYESSRHWSPPVPCTLHIGTFVNCQGWQGTKPSGRLNRDDKWTLKAASLHGNVSYSSIPMAIPTWRLPAESAASNAQILHSTLDRKKNKEL